MFCISIGFIVQHRPVIGVIYAPFQDQLFSACSGRGAWLNESRQLPLIHKPSIPPMPPHAPAQCIFSCEWGKDRRDTPDGNMHRKIESFMNMAAELGGRNGKGGMVHGVRSLGSATLDLAYTAMGSFDIWWEGGCWEWYVFSDALHCFSFPLSFFFSLFLVLTSGIGMWLLASLFSSRLVGW